MPAAIIIVMVVLAEGEGAWSANSPHTDTSNSTDCRNCTVGLVIVIETEIRQVE
jgi:hypothetical protein